MSELLEDPDFLICGCGMPLSRNPHPQAGELPTLHVVGPVWVCIPCLTRNRRAHAEATARERREVRRLREVARQAHRLMPVDRSQTLLLCACGVYFTRPEYTAHLTEQVGA